MTRDFKLYLTRISGTPLGDGFRGGADEMKLCGIGITRQGQRILFEPAPIANVNQSIDITIEPPYLIKKIEIPRNETDLLFCFWLYEQDNDSLARFWSRVVDSYGFWMDRKLQELRPFRYPENQLQFQAFTEILFDIHSRVRTTADVPNLGWGDGDDVYIPTLIRASHLGSNVEAESLHRAYEGQTSGNFAVSRGASHYSLYFRYNFSEVDLVVA